MSALWLRGAERLPADIALAIIPSLPRAHLERLAQQIIDHLDDEDGEPDVEPNGDEEDGTRAEDDFSDHWWDGPGCPIADPGERDNTDLPMVNHDGEDQSVIIIPAPAGIEHYRYKVT